MHRDQSKQFQRYMFGWYRMYGRHELPWRLTADPYAILVSELMLQQTQVSRVIPKYLAFLERFPNLESLRSTQLVEVLRLWQGLGYNRRAKYLWQLAQQVGQLPTTEAQLRQLHGIGPYTAAAICAFAYNQPVVMIETNIRTVFLYHFFHQQEAVSDKEILSVLSETLDRSNARQWYWALMDYGSHLKSVLPNPSRASKHHSKQSTFAGSDRQIRGTIIRELINSQPLTTTQLTHLLEQKKQRVTTILESLVTDGMIVKKNGQWSITPETGEA